MGRQNKKKDVAEHHKETIMQAAEKLFLEKGFAATTITDISQAAEYSRRTIYAYYESKEDILHHIVLKGLLALKDNIQQAKMGHSSFIEQYYAICGAMKDYFMNSPQSFLSVNQADAKEIDFNLIPPAAKRIFALGTEINRLLGDFIEDGKQSCIVRSEVHTMKTVYILWSSISSLLSLVQSKGTFLEKEFSSTQDEFLQYGFTQIINSILEERIS